MSSRHSHAIGERFKDRVCMVTGGSRGIGRGCVRVFARNGAKVVFCALDEDEGKSVEKEVNEQGPGEAVYIRCDVTKENEIKSLIEEAVARFGRIDCLVNNAAAHPHQQLIDDTTAGAFRDLFDLNVLGYFLTSKYALPHIRKTEGCIINIGSLVAQIGQPGAIPYAATKGAVSAMTRAMAIDEAVYNVRVNAISPGNIWTPMWDDWASSSGDREKAIQEGVQAQLLGRMGTPQEAGELCLYLAAEATFLTGVDIPLSGGAELNYGTKSRRESAEASAAAAAAAAV